MSDKRDIKECMNIYIAPIYSSFVSSVGFRKFRLEILQTSSRTKPIPFLDPAIRILGQANPVPGSRDPESGSQAVPFLDPGLSQRCLLIQRSGSWAKLSPIPGPFNPATIFTDYVLFSASIIIIQKLTKKQHLVRQVLHI